MLNTYHQYFLLDGKACDTSDYNPEILKSGISIYEVMICLDGIHLFIEEHLDRLERTAKKLNFKLWLNRKEIVEQMDKLVEINNVKNGNIEFFFHNSDLGKHFCCLFIPDNYPSNKMYREGIPSSLFQAERDNPTAKQINLQLRKKTVKNIDENKVFEIVLVDKKANITEGSRSNIFFIKNNELFTANVELVLPGIMRNQIIDICQKNDIKVNECSIPANTIANFEASFFTNTTAKAIAISNIGEIKYKADHPLLVKVLNLFEERINNYLEFRS